ncbi:hypothetical protein ACOMHN_035855 [Nucella lapillus]
MRAALTALHLVLFMESGLGQSALNVSKLTDDLMTINPTVRPVSDLSQPTVVNISFHLKSIIALDIVGQKMVSNGWLQVTWQSDYHTWDPEQYEGVRSITPSVKQMWRPRLTLRNTLKELKGLGEEYIVMILESNGWVGWLPAEHFETFCHVDVSLFPFDRQTCKWQLFLWGQTTKEVILKSMLPEIDMDTYQANGEWDIINSKALEMLMNSGNMSYSELIYEVTLQRKPLLLAMTVVLPMMVLSVVNVFVFTIPSEAGERLSYSMTSFLTFGVFMSFIVDLMPSSTESLSIMAALMSCQLVLSAFYVLLCILSLRLFHRDPHRHPVSARLQTTIIYLELMLCLDPPSRQPVQVASSDGLMDDVHGTEVKVSRVKGHLDRWVKKKQVKEEAYRQPQDMTWQRVSRSLDKLLFRFFFCLIMVSHTAYITIMAYVYNY